jgi:hypothetical protein
MIIVRPREIGLPTGLALAAERVNVIFLLARSHQHESPFTIREVYHHLTGSGLNGPFPFLAAGAEAHGDEPEIFPELGQSDAI